MRQISRTAGISLAIALACVAAFALQHDLVQLSRAAALQAADLLALAVVLSLGNYALRAVRWRSYLTLLGCDLPLRFAALTYVAGFAYTVSPGKVGEMARARYYARLRVPLSDVAAAFLIERLMDVLAMVVLAALLVAVSVSAPYRSATLAAGLLAAGVLAALASLPWNGIAPWLQRASRLPEWLRRALAGAVSPLCAARPLLHPSVLAFAFVTGLSAWGLEGIGLDVISRAFPAAHLSLAAALGIYGVAVLVGGLSLLPGGLGSTEAVMIALLAAHGFPLAQALTATLLCRLATLWLAVGLGWGAVLALRPRAMAAAAPWR